MTLSETTGAFWRNRISTISVLCLRFTLYYTVYESLLLSMLDASEEYLYLEGIPAGAGAFELFSRKSRSPCAILLSYNCLKTELIVYLTGFFDHVGNYISRTPQSNEIKFSQRFCLFHRPAGQWQQVCLANVASFDVSNRICFEMSRSMHNGSRNAFATRKLSSRGAYSHHAVP